jgi:hypothetical protein
MEESKLHDFNTDELLTEMNYVIKKGLTKVFKEFIERHELLENTHKQIMNLPSVLKELNITADDEDDEDDNDETNSEPVIYKNVSKDLETLHNKINSFETKLETGMNALFKIVEKLGKEVKSLKEQEVKEETKIMSSIVTSCENENIKVVITDPLLKNPLLKNPLLKKVEQNV